MNERTELERLRRQNVRAMSLLLQVVNLLPVDSPTRHEIEEHLGLADARVTVFDGRCPSPEEDLGHVWSEMFARRARVALDSTAPEPGTDAGGNDG